MDEPSHKTRPLARPLPGRAHRADPERLAVAVEHVQSVPLSPALFEERLDGWREPEGKYPGLAALRARILQPNRSTLPVHRCPGEQPPFVPTPARRAEELH